jgi:hypothetical protein
MKYVRINLNRASRKVSVKIWILPGPPFECTFTSTYNYRHITSVIPFLVRLKCLPWLIVVRAIRAFLLLFEVVITK